ncbi:MAG: CHAT domain-containing protein, partial [Cyanobacteria bacterium]|nr:CHAT domain-containing protein [Cyanobacteriota bacterium]MDW8201454.1 CHAT domain-containing protein [Cyanobacteriota bacterium SKYGB_h_bin112]
IQVLQLTQARRRLLDQESRAGAASALIVGNPTMPQITFQLGGKPETLSALPGAEQEAKTIANLLQTQALVHDQATKSAVLARLPNARIIHLATHGFLNDFEGQGIPGAIALAPELKTAQPMAQPLGKIDGLLTASEILELTLVADLVTLSACDTGRGRITGDGVIGLSRSWLAAGAASLVVSLWKVPDDSTVLLMTEFYRNLQQGQAKAEALRQAMITTKAVYPDPIDWAAFTLIGNVE